MRSLLIVPTGDAAAIADGFASGADAVVIEAADAALAPKSAAPAIYVRLSSLDDPQAWSDLETALAKGAHGVALARACGGADVQRLGARLAVQEAALGMPDGAIRILAFATETPQALFGLASYRGASERLDGLLWSVTPLGGGAAHAAGPLRLARDLTLFAARAAGVLALDAAFADVDDLQGLRAEAVAARDDGFDGKAAHSVQQVAVLNEVFARSA